MTLFINTVRKKIKRERGHKDSHLELLWKGSWQEAPQRTRVEMRLWGSHASFIPGPRQDTDVTLGNHCLFLLHNLYDVLG